MTRPLPARRRSPGPRPRLLLGAGLALAVLLAAAAPARAAAVSNGLPAEREDAGRALDPSKAMMWKYVAACALRPDQQLSNPKDPRDGPFRGRLGLAPEWLGGKCDEACRQKVSACLLALTNRTGKHVQLSLTSAAPGMAADLRPGEGDRTFPFQEGAFFGDVFRGKGYVCHGRDDRKGPQVKRFCAAEPASCDGLFTFTDAGRCQDACTLTCSRLSDGSERCPAARCRSSDGQTWDYPLTTYLRDAIEAGNADELTGAVADDAQALLVERDGASALYRGVDLGPKPRPRHALVLTYAADGPTRVTVALAGGRRLAEVALPPTGGHWRAITARFDGAGLTGFQDLRLRFAGPPAAHVRLSTLACDPRE